jgi:hypothetical protein
MVKFEHAAGRDMAEEDHRMMRLFSNNYTPTRSFGWVCE